MFPIHDRRGQVIGFGGRTLGDGQPKYVNSPETPLFAKRRCLYAVDLAREGAFRGARVVAVEGYMDVIALHQAGFGAAVAPLGTALTAEQLEALWRLSPEPVLCFDGDAAGARAAARAAEVALPLLAPDRSLRLATLPPGEDPDSLVGKAGAAGFEAVLAAAEPLHSALYRLLVEGRPGSTPEARAALRHRLVEAAGRIGDRALAAEYRRSLLDRFFASARTGRSAPAIRRPPRPAIDSAATGEARARCLLAILLAHPWLLAEVEEALAELDLPPGPGRQLGSALSAWLSTAPALDSPALLDHLRQTGLAAAVDWALRPGGRPAAAESDAQPAEALAGWWHFFGLMRGERALAADRAAAERDWVASNDPAAQARLIRLTEALAALRRGEAEGAGEGASRP
jgi:DNA primase